MPSTLIVSGTEGMGAERYRVFHRRELLELQGLTCKIIGYSELERRFNSIRAIRELIDPADIVLFHRTAYGDLIGDMLGEIAAQGKPAVFDLDDLVFEPELTRFHRGVELLSPDDQTLYHSGVRRYLQMLERCDYFIGATDYLAELARQRGRVAFVDRNSLSLRFTTEAAAARRWVRKSPEALVIGYSSGTHTHDHDFLEAADALVEILATFPHVRLSLLGPLVLDSRFTPFTDRVEQIPLIGWERVPHVTAQWDINLAPLEIENPFCRSKSELKYFEAGMLGIPTVASKIEAFEHAIRDGQNGFLCRTKDEWLRALRQLIEDPGLRERIGHAAELHTIANYTPRQRSEGFVKLLDRIIEHHRLRPGSSLPVPTGTTSARTSRLAISWVLPVPFAGSGGHMTIFRNVRFLQQFGHQCTIYLEGGGKFTNSDQLAQFLRAEFIDTGAAVRLGFDEIANCDALIATHWSTVSAVQASDACSRKLYFVQDFEPYFTPMSTDWILAEQTYRLGMRCITIGRWLTNLLRFRYNADAEYIDFAVDTSTYYPRAVPRSDPPVVCALAQPEKPRRGFDLLVKALDRLHQRCPEAKIVLYGSIHIPAHLPFPFENAGLLGVSECADLYSRSTVGIILSMSNPSLIGFEMMACGCAVVDLDLENNHFDYGARDNLVLARPDPDSLAGAVIGLIKDPAHCREIADAGRQHIHSRSYELSARRFEQHILRSQQDPGITHSRDVFQLRQNGVVGEIVGGLDVAQSFRCSTNLLCAIDVSMATYARSNDSRVTLSLRRETFHGEEVARVTVPATCIRDNDWMRFEFAPILVSEAKKFVIVIRSDDAVHGHAVTVHADSDCCLDDGQLWIAGKEQPGALRFRTYCLRRSDLLPAMRPMTNHRPDVLPKTNPESRPAIASRRDDIKVSEILRTIQRINHDKTTQIRELQYIIHQKEEYIHRLQTHLALTTSSRSWRAIHRVRGILRRVKRSVVTRVKSS